MTDRDEIEKLAEELYNKHCLEGDWLWTRCNSDTPPDLAEKKRFRKLAKHVLVTFVPRSEHEELKQESERLKGERVNGSTKAYRTQITLGGAFLTNEQFRQMPEEDRIAINDVLTKRAEALARKRMELGLDRDDPACCG